MRSQRLIVQYLEGASDAARMAPEAAVSLLRQAFAQLPITDVCLGWRLAPTLLQAATTFIRAESRAALWLWHPLLTGDGSEPLRDDDLTIGLDGNPIRETSDAFTFVCPNRDGALERAIQRLRSDLASAAYDGVFLDRIRWPSPAQAPDRLLTCFCDACGLAAATDGLDLERVASGVRAMSETPAGRRQLVAALLGEPAPDPIDRFLRWRSSVIRRTVERSIAEARPERIVRVALDVFSPSLTWMVGQDLASLAPGSEWVKAMIYTTVHAPAGLPFELGALLRWLGEVNDGDWSEFVSGLVGYPIPSLVDLAATGLGPSALRVEIERLGRVAGDVGAAGIEAVHVPEVVTMTEPMLRERVRIASDLRVPIVLSWDLAQMPPAWIGAIGAELSQRQED